MSALLDIEQLKARAEGAIIGQQIEYFDEIESTNAYALTRADDDANHGLVVFAEKQTAGRGRFHRQWLSPKGASILCSTLLFADRHSTVASSVLLWSALAVREALELTHGIQPVIKWPNDLMIDNRKLCGILIESRHTACQRCAMVIGIGINCLQHQCHFSDALGKSATSLDLLSNQPVDRTLTASALLDALNRRYESAQRLGPERIKQQWLTCAIPLGKRLTVQTHNRQFSGSLVELDPELGILIELDHGGRQLFSASTTTILRME